MDRVDKRVIQIISYYCEYEDIISLHCCNSLLYSRRDPVILKPLIKRRIVKFYNIFVNIVKLYSNKIYIPEIELQYLENIAFDELKEIYIFLNNYDIDDIKLELREVTDRYYEECVINNIKANIEVTTNLNQILVIERDFILETIKEISCSLFEDLLTGGIRYCDNYDDREHVRNIYYIISYNFLYLFKIYLNRFPHFLDGWDIYSDTLMICYRKRDISRLEYIIYELKHPYHLNVGPNMILHYIEGLYEKLVEYNITKERVDELYRSARELFKE